MTLTPELYGLAGVVVGAILGGFAQVVGLAVQQRLSHKGWHRDNLAAASAAYYEKCQRLERKIDRWQQDEPPPADEYFSEVWDAITPVIFFGSGKVGTFAVAYHDQLLDWYDARHTSTADEAKRVQESLLAADRAFVRAVCEALGLPTR